MGTIAQEITRIQGGVNDVWDYCEDNGVSIPAGTTVDEARFYLDQIPHGGPQTNPFDGADFSYLLYGNRFLNNLDDIYNSSRTGLSHWGFNHMTNIDGQNHYMDVSSSQMQKMIDIMQKFISCGDKKFGAYYAFYYLNITDDDNQIIFRPTYSNYFSYFNFSQCFYLVKGATGKSVDFTVDFSNIYDKIVSHTNNNMGGLVFAGTNINVHIINLPVSPLIMRTDMTIGSTSNPGAILDITVKGSLGRNLNIKTCTRMTVEKCVDFFNSFDAKTVSNNVTITIPTSLYNQLTEEQKQIITDKGYILASA